MGAVRTAQRIKAEMQRAVRSTRSEISDPHQISAIGDCNLRVPVAKVAVEQPGLILPANMISHAPLRGDAGRQWFPSPNAALAGLAGFAGREAGSAGHCSLPQSKRPRR
jgi:hypothetical protein